MGAARRAPLAAGRPGSRRAVADRAAGRVHAPGRRRARDRAGEGTRGATVGLGPANCRARRVGDACQGTRFGRDLANFPSCVTRGVTQTRKFGRVPPYAPGFRLNLRRGLLARHELERAAQAVLELDPGREAERLAASVSGRARCAAPRPGAAGANCGSNVPPPFSMPQLAAELARAARPGRAPRPPRRGRR